MRRDGIGEPDQFVPPVEVDAVPPGLRGADGEDDGPAPFAPSDLPRRGLVDRQVDVLAAHRPQPLPPDRVERRERGAVVEDRGRRGRTLEQPARQGVAVERPDAAPAQLEAPFVGLRDQPREVVLAQSRPARAPLAQGGQ